MTERNWTPGPWVVTDCGDISTMYGEPVVEAGAGYFLEVGMADANLIASAPDLYEALEAMTELRNNTSPFGGELQEDRIEMAFVAANAALAKARGET